MPEPFNAFSHENIEIYEWFKHLHPQWWLEIDAKHLIGIKVTRANLSEQFPVIRFETHEWNALWTILVTRQASEMY